MKKNNSEVTQKQKNTFKTLSVVCFILGAVIMLVSVITKLSLYLVGALFFVLMLFFYLRATDHDKKIEMTREKSDTREDMTGHYLTRLPSAKFKVAKFEKSSTENPESGNLRFLVIGVNGIFPVFTINTDGTVTGKIDDEILTVTDDSGKTKQITNEAVKYAEQVEKIAAKVEKTGVKLDIVPILFFPSFRCKVNVGADESDCRIISNTFLHGENLIREISRYKSGKEPMAPYLIEKVYSSFTI